MATAIESKLSLALAVKLKAIFEQADNKEKFLCFPKGIAFTYDYLKFMQPFGESGLSAAAQQANKCDFSRLMNLAFADSLQYLPDASTFLWQDFENILKNSTFPETTLSESEEKQLADAKKFLVIETVDANGLVTSAPTPAFNAYINYKTICDKANSVYLDEKLTVENSTGDERVFLKKKWQEYREKQLLDMINQANNDWLNLGYKAQVENYTVVKKTLEQKKFVNLVRSSYLNDMDQSDLPDQSAGGLPTKVTFFSPNDIMDKTVPWVSIHLTGGEINSFVAQAPAELKAIFNDGEGNNDIEAVSLEYNQVAIIRPWWKPEYFSSRYWKLPDNTVVSTGGTPNQGKIPAYISSMIVARNITITRRKTSATQSSGPLIIPILSSFSVKTATPVSTHIATGKQNLMLKKQVNLQLDATEVKVVKPERTVANAGLSVTKPMMAARMARMDVNNDVAILKNEQILERKQKYTQLKYIGTTIGTPIIYIPEDITPPATQETPDIDLIQLAGDAQTRWASSQLIDEHNTIDDTNLIWMQEGGGIGQANSISNALMEDGQHYTVLFTHPKWVNGGTIKGWFAWRVMPQMARLKTKIGFLNGAFGTDGVTFWVWLHHKVNGIERWQPIYQKVKTYTNSLETVDIDLSAYAGQAISIELRVDTGPFSDQDWAAWVEPVITSIQAEPVPTSTELVTETYPFDGVFVLAYGCKRVAKSPDHDPSLKWP